MQGLTWTSHPPQSEFSNQVNLPFADCLFQDKLLSLRFHICKTGITTQHRLQSRLKKMVRGKSSVWSLCRVDRSPGYLQPTDGEYEIEAPVGDQ